jgi:hypothetical protein
MTKSKTDMAAIMAHEANRVWCILNGDDSQPEWDDAPAWQMCSAIQGVKFHIANPDAGDSASHDSWMKQKIADGWVYGDVKRPDATPPTHPCIVPFGDLPSEQQTKDALFRSIVHAVLCLKTTSHSKTTVTDTSFNPSGNEAIHDIKTKANAVAEAINALPPTRRRSVALTQLEGALMWAVKAAAVGDDI